METKVRMPTGEPSIDDPVEKVALDFLEAAEGNPSLALRMLALHALVLEGSVRDREKFISRGYVRAAMPRCLAKGVA